MRGKVDPVATRPWRGDTELPRLFQWLRNTSKACVRFSRRGGTLYVDPLRLDETIHNLNVSILRAAGRRCDFLGAVSFAR
jgi:hypothetical protein